MLCVCILSLNEQPRCKAGLLFYSRILRRLGVSCTGFQLSREWL